MIIKYVLKNFSRRKIRTILMLLALFVGVAALVALNATVDTYERFFLATISNSAGDYDLVITKKEIEPELLIDPQAVIPVVGGVVWEAVGAQYTFLFGVVIAVISLALVQMPLLPALSFPREAILSCWISLPWVSLSWRVRFSTIFSSRWVMASSSRICSVTSRLISTNFRIFPSVSQTG